MDQLLRRKLAREFVSHIGNTVEMITEEHPEWSAADVAEVIASWVTRAKLPGDPWDVRLGVRRSGTDTKGITS